jgi:hypothetical protein
MSILSPATPRGTKQKGRRVGLAIADQSIASDIGDAILSHYDFTDASRFHTERNRRGLFIHLKSGEKEVRSLLVNTDDKPQVDDEVGNPANLVNLASLDNLTPDQWQSLRAALQSHDGIESGPFAASDLGSYFFNPDAEVEADQQIYAGLLSLSDLTVWLGKEKHRKSNLILLLAICASLGLDFLGFRFVADKPLRVMLIDFESKGRSLKIRYDAIVKAMKLDARWQEQLRTNLTILEVKKIRKAGHSFPKFPVPSKSKVPEADLTFWRQLVAENPADLYIIDPLRTLHTADENDSAIEALLTELQRVFGRAAVVLAHHMRKASENAMTLAQDMRVWSDGARGSSAIKAHSDVIVLQERIENDGGEEIVFLGAFLKDGADIDPFPVMETDHESFYWEMKAHVPAKLVKSHDALKAGRFATKAQAAAAIKTATKVGRATAWRHLDSMIRLRIVTENPDGSISAQRGV